MKARRFRNTVEPREVLGINKRNLEYVYRLNPRERFPLVDDKITAKGILERAGLRVARSYAQVETRGAIGSCVEALRNRQSFVVKPARGFGGEGIRVVRGENGIAELSSEQVEDLTCHMAAILSGMFALDSLSDRVLVEEYLDEDPALRTIHGGSGVSDLRVIVCASEPVMAMLRLPCKASSPTANLHRGGIGVGIDMDTGQTTFAIRNGRTATTHPDTGLDLEGITIPGFDDILDMVRPLNRLFGLDYLGADIVLDRARGPVFLEVNARPGLAIQLANRRGLATTLSRLTSASDRG